MDSPRADSVAPKPLGVKQETLRNVQGLRVGQSVRKNELIFDMVLFS